MISRLLVVWLTASPFPMPVYLLFLLPGAPHSSLPISPSAVLRRALWGMSVVALSDECALTPLPAGCL